MRILVIDDDPILRDQIAASLRAYSFSVDTANDGTSGFYLARTNEYDLLILDNMLPEKSGAMLCQDLRRIGKHMPVLILSVLDETWRKVELLNGGADDYLTKPFRVKSLWLVYMPFYDGLEKWLRIF